jgi:hypothetical protein
MSQVNKCYSVLFPPPIYLASIRNRVQLPDVSRPVRSYSRNLITWSLGVPNYSDFQHPSHLSVCQMWTSVEHKISRLHKQTTSWFLCIVSSLRRVYTDPPGWSTRLNQRNWIQRLNDTVYTVPQKWTRQSIPKWRQMNLWGKVLL